MTRMSMLCHVFTSTYAQPALVRLKNRINCPKTLGQIRPAFNIVSIGQKDI